MLFEEEGADNVVYHMLVLDRDPGTLSFHVRCVVESAHGQRGADTAWKIQLGSKTRWAMAEVRSQLPPQ